MEREAARRTRKERTEEAAERARQKAVRNTKNSIQPSLQIKCKAMKASAPKPKRQKRVVAAAALEEAQGGASALL